MKHKWPLTPLGEVLAERTEIPSMTDVATGQVPIIGKISFGSGFIQLRTSGTTKTGMILIHPGDLVVSGINAAKGAIAVYDADATTPAAATIHYGAYIPNRERINVTFLWWLLRSALFKEVLLEHLPGGIKTELKAKRLLRVPVPIPSLPIQAAIVRRVETLAAKVREAQITQKESFALTKVAFESAIESRMWRAPVSGTLRDVISFNPRSGPSFVTHPDWTGTPVIMVSAVTGFGCNTIKVEYGMGTEAINPKDRLEPGDVLMARGNKREQVGNAGVVPHAARGWVCANLLMRMRLDERQADSHFAVYWLRSPSLRRLVGTRMTGTSPNIQKINQRVILGLPFPTGLPVSEQRRVVSELDALNTQLNAVKSLQTETTAELDALLPAILDRAFRGEL